MSLGDIRTQRCTTLVLTTMLLLEWLPGCSGKAGPKVQTPKPARRSRSLGPGFQLHLEEASLPAAAEAEARAPVSKGQTLGDAQVKALLARLQPIATEAEDVKSFALRPGSLPPPRTGVTLQGVFPPPRKPEVPEAPEPGPLRVLRFSPEGEVNLAPNLSVTFSQPMVAVTSHAASVVGGVPVKLTPAVEGKWRWVGTKTLLFEPKIRFPMATAFQAEVPAGTTSATGGKLEQATQFKFATPPPRLIQSFPPQYGPQRVDTLLFLGFDQGIDPAAVLSKLSLEGDSKPVTLRLAGTDEIAQDEQVSALVQGAEPKRFLAVKPAQKLSPATSYQLTVAAGTPSKEGPLTTKEPQHFRFRTYDPLAIQYRGCQWRGYCVPLEPLSVTFNNALDEESFDPKLVRVTPALADMRVEQMGSNIVVYGQTKGQTTYRVTYPASLGDIYGQKLNGPVTEPFKVGKADPAIFASSQNFVVLDPSGEKSFPVYSINHKELELRLYAVGPEDWDKWREWFPTTLQRTPITYPPGRLVQHRVLRPKGADDELTETQIDLRPALSGGYGQVIVLVNERPLNPEPWRRQVVAAWVQVTELGLDAVADAGELNAWVTHLRDGSPVAGAEVSMFPPSGNAKTDQTGLASLGLPAFRRGQVLLARLGKDLAMLPESRSAWGGSVWRSLSSGSDTVRWFVFDDRKLYKPKEEVRVKGWARIVELRKGGGVKGLGGGGQTLSWTAYEPRGNKIASGETQLTTLGGFDFKFSLPDSANLGHARVELSLAGVPASDTTTSHYFSIQEFRRPEFEVSSSASDGPHFMGGAADVSVTASYFAGGPLPGAEVSWQVTASPGSFTPPNRAEYTFGESVWSSYYYGDSSGGPRNPQPKSFSARTDGKGTHRLRIHFEVGSGKSAARTGAAQPFANADRWSQKKSPEAPAPASEEEALRPMSVSATATVFDVNRQSWATTTPILVHPGRYYVGLKTARTFVEHGEPLKIGLVVADLDGKLIEGQKVEVQAVRLEGRYQRGRWRQEELDPQTCTVTSAKSPVECRFKTDKGGSYRISAEVRDPEGRRSRTRMDRWVAGGKLPPSRDLKKQEVKLVADKPSYQPGETAEILVLAPFSPSEALVTLQRSGIIEKRRIRIDGSTVTLRVPIKEEYLPNLHVNVSLVGSASRANQQGEEDSKLPKRPAFASGTLSLSIPPLKRELKLEVRPQRPKLEPGSETEVEVLVQDASGRPAADAEVAVIAVDEAVLALTGYKLGSPTPSFYPFRSGDTVELQTQDAVLLADPEALRGKLAAAPTSAVQELTKSAGAAPGGRGGGMPPPAPRAAARDEAVLGGARAKQKVAKGADAEAAAPIAVRKDFDALALFEPALRTDQSGRARVKLKVKDSLTRYRVMAVAVLEKQFGEGESTVTARLPLMVRPSAPRFLNFGDRFELPVVIQNQTDGPLPVQVAVRGSNVKLVQGQGRAVTVPPNDRVELRFPAAAASPGTARFQLAAASGSWSDAAEISLPVWTPATTEAFATYGTVDSDRPVVQPVKPPPDAVTEFGGLEVGTSSTELQALTDAVLYLYAYPYECSEQLSSRMLAIAALRDVLAAFKAPGLPPPETVVKRVTTDLKRLQGMQNGDGGFPIWERGQTSWPFLSCHVVHALVRAKSKRFEVPEPMLQQGLGHLRRIESYIPGWYGPEARRAIIAYSLYVRSLAGDADVVKARRIFDELKAEKELALEGVAWLYPVFSAAKASAELAEIRKLLRNRVTETASTAQFATSYGDSGYLLMYSDRRVDGLLLEGLIQDQPKSDLIVKLVRGLLGHRKAGRWGNTQENAWVLLALDKYFNTYERVTPNFVARVWLGDRFAGEHPFKGRSTERYAIDIPMGYLTSAGPADLLLQRQGAGRLYYRIGMRYAPKDLRPPPASHGFTVERVYSSVDNPDDVKRSSDGTWVVRAGARVKVELTLVAPARRYHVALVDPLPAGLEPLNPALLGSQPPPAAAPGTGNEDLRGRHGLRRGRSPYMGRPFHFMPWWWGGRWYEHQNLRDERAEAFTSLLWEGVHTYSYFARATTPGTFVVPPPRAEEMYAPETFGRGAGDRLIVE